MAEPTRGVWRSIPTIQTMHDGTVLKTFGVQVQDTQEWVGKAHPIGPSPENLEEAWANAALFAGSKAMNELLVEALSAWAEQFDGTSDEDLEMSCADVVEWFSEWRARVRARLAAR